MKPIPIGYVHIHAYLFPTDILFMKWNLYLDGFGRYVSRGKEINGYKRIVLVLAGWNIEG